MGYNAAANSRFYQKHKTRRDAENRARQQRLYEWVNAYRKEHPCIRCGETDTRCLDFHHRNPADKEIEVANALRWGWSVQRLGIEILKCDVLCANCHRKLHRVGM